jgi:HNH endonuclease
MAEEWKDVPGLEGVLLASSEGRIARLQGYEAGHGYLGVSVPAHKAKLCVLTSNLSITDKGCYMLMAHRVIAVTFLGDPPDGKNDVNHLDGNKRNNRISNIEWSSRKDNLEHARRAGLQTDRLRKYTETQYKQARILRDAGHKWKYIATELGMSIGAAHHAAIRSQRGRTEHRPWREAE